jgi:DNA polymerase-3 subunit beta
VGEAKESVPVQFSGEPLEIGFNAEFLREGIESIGADDLRLKLISPLRPAVIEGADDDPTYLIMPIRLPG